MKNDFNRNPRTEVAVVYDNGIGNIIPKKHKSVSIFGRHSDKAVIDDMEFDNLVQFCRTALAKNAMQETAILSNLEETLSIIYPKGSERYRLIADAFTAATIRGLLKW